MYDKYIDTKDLAKMLRDYVKENFKDYKFSITSKKFAGGQSLNISLTSGKTNLTDIDKVKEFIERPNDRKEYIIKHLQEQNLTLEDLYNDSVMCDKEMGVMGSINHYMLERGCEKTDRAYLLKDEIYNMFVKINDFIRQYHWCDSDLMTDYYVCNFYYDLYIDYNYYVNGCDKKLITDKSMCQTHEELYKIMDGKRVRLHWLDNTRRSDIVGIFHTKATTYEVINESGKVLMSGYKGHEFTRITENGFEKVENTTKDFPPYLSYTILS